MKYELSDTEKQAATAWREKHAAECPYRLAHASEPFKGLPTEGGSWWYKFTPTGLGCCIQVGCSFCGKYKDVTDISNW